MTFSERELGKVFKVELEKQKFELVDVGYHRKPYSTDFKVHLNKPVSTHTRKFEKFWRMKNLDPKDIPPAQPEIDMILVDNLGIMRAVEIKVIRKTRKGVRPSYYFGLGQTLAYLSFGFQQVAIWQCFDGDSLTDKEIYEYNDAFTKIRAPIGSFLDATYFRILNMGQKLRIQTSTYYHGRPRKWNDGIGIHIPQTGEFRMRWNSFNPFRKTLQTSSGIFVFDASVRKQVGTIYEFLESQREKLWEK